MNFSADSVIFIKFSSMGYVSFTLHIELYAIIDIVNNFVYAGYRLFLHLLKLTYHINEVKNTKISTSSLLRCVNNVHFFSLIFFLSFQLLIYCHQLNITVIGIVIELISNKVQGIKNISRLSNMNSETNVFLLVLETFVLKRCTLQKFLFLPPCELLPELILRNLPLFNCFIT
jgi:hypothetical protein